MDIDELRESFSDRLDDLIDRADFIETEEELKEFAKEWGNIGADGYPYSYSEIKEWGDYFRNICDENGWDDLKYELEINGIPVSEED